MKNFFGRPNEVPLSSYVQLPEGDRKEKAEINVPHQTEDPPIGQRIRAERLRQGINLRSLARQVNVSASHISQIETGKCRPSVSTLFAITTALGVQLDDIFEEESAQCPPAHEVPGEASTDSAQPTGHRTDAPGRAANGSPWASAIPLIAPGAGREYLRGEAAGAGAVALPSLPDNAAAITAFAAGRSDRDRLGPVVTPCQREVLELDSGVTWERLGHVPGMQVEFLLITYAPSSSSSSTNQLMRHSGTEYGFLVTGQLTVTLGFSNFKMTAGDAICFPSSTPHRYRNEDAEPAIGVWFVVDGESEFDTP